MKSHIIRIGLVVALATALLGVQPAAAAPPECIRDARGGHLICSGDVSSTLPPSGGGGGARRTGSSSSQSDQQYAPIDRLMTGPDGQTCVGTGYVPVPDGTPTVSPTIGRDFGPIMRDYAPCPGADSAPVVTPSMVAASFWQRLPLPVPQPRIAPGRAITGKSAYLETNGQVEHTYTEDTVLGPLEIHATGRYFVDWGDGTKTGPYSVEGKPWPDGQIRHTYVWARSVDVLVTEKWTATWRLGGASGTLWELETTGRIDDFPVEEIQVVIE